MMTKKTQLTHLWCKVGLVVQLSQMMEYNLAKILALDEILRGFENRDSMFDFEYRVFVKSANKWYRKLSRKPLGKSLLRAKSIEFFTEEGEKRLSQAIDKRNYVVHQLFKDDLQTNHLETDPTFYYEELENTMDLLQSVNNDLIEIYNKQKAEYQLIW
ncbi:MAG: hypothetical protein IJT60_06920 [Clostridia bacterium]|nr:hypothetical protein [Clostridia bacterium]